MRVIAFLLTLVVASGCSSTPKDEPKDLREDYRESGRMGAPGLPENLWDGFAPGSWVRVKWTAPWGENESTLRVMPDRRVLDDISDRSLGVPHGFLIDPFHVWAPEKWVEEDYSEEVIVDRKSFDCRVREGEVFLDGSLNRIPKGVKAAYSLHFRVAAQSDAKSINAWVAGLLDEKTRDVVNY